MKWQTFDKDLGEIGVESRLGTDQDERKAEGLFSKIVENFIRFNASYYEELSVFPFVYREDQVRPILFASTLDAGALPFAEDPVHRKKAPELTTRGLLDLSLYYRDMVFLTEVKHTMLPFNWRGEEVKEFNKWKDALDKLKAITPDSIDYLSGEPRRKCLKLALFLVTIYQKSVHKWRISPKRKTELAFRGDKLSNVLSPRPNWVALWVTPTEWQRDFKEWRVGSYESYPGLFFLASLESAHYERANVWRLS